MTDKTTNQPANEATNQSPDKLSSQNSLPIAANSHVFKNSLL